MSVRSNLLSIILLSLALAACSSTTKSSKSSGTPSRRTKAPTAAEARTAVRDAAANSSLEENRRVILQEASQWIGTPYKYGGASREGTDCSGFVLRCYSRAECPLPRSSSQQAAKGESIDLEDALPGDLVFFNTSGSGVSHVGILISNDRFVHASTSIGVTVNSLSESYYRQRLMFVRRVLP